ncbi:MAG: acyltransferase [Desulfobacteraceae bacterium]|nr:MAG: acyltransferase [Desulfobacteraceae bacterium]
MIEIADSATISKMADIEESVKGTKIIIGPFVRVDSFVKIKPVGGLGDIVIGDHTYINSGTVIYSGNGVRIGSGVLIAANCTIAPVNHEFRSRSQSILDQRFSPSKGGIVIEDDVWIGANTVILDGSYIQRGVVVGAGSIVRGVLEAYSIYAGAPLKTIGKRE